jgi:regulator of sirC expression with transglutaminase-like and TPR domain
MVNSIDRFLLELKTAQPQIDRLALTIAEIAYPGLTLQRHLDALDEMAHYMEARLAAFSGRSNQARRFLDIFNEDLGFTGNRSDYYDPDNSYLNVVLERRTGLPILLCLVCVALGQRLGLAIEGMGFPGHFMARMNDESGRWFLDPFNGIVLTQRELNGHLTRILGQRVSLDTTSFQSLDSELWAQRILFNLRNAYLGQHNNLMAIQVLNYLLAFLPNHSTLWRERGLLHYQVECKEEALRDLRRSFSLTGQTTLLWNTHEERQSAIAELGQEEQDFVHLYDRLIEWRNRAN